MPKALRFARVIAVLVAIVALSLAQTSAQTAPLKIGVIATFSGITAVSGQLIEDAISAYMQEHGDTIAGRKVVIVKRDTGGPQPDVARREMQDLIVNEKVDIVLGPEYSANTSAIAPLSTQAKKPVIVINSAQTGVIDNAPYMVNFGNSARQVQVPLARWTIQTGLKRAYVLYANFGPGLDGANVFRDTLVAAGGTVVGESSFPLSTLDFSAEAQRIKDANPDVLWTFIVIGPQGSAMLKALREVGLLGPNSKLKILDSGGITDEPNLDVIGNDALGVISSTFYSDAHNSRLNRSFVQRFEKIDPKMRPDFVAASTYDAMAATYAAAAEQNGNLDPDRTLAFLKGRKFEGVGGPLQIDPTTRLMTRNIYIRRVDGRGTHLYNVEIDTVPMVKQ